MYRYVVLLSVILITGCAATQDRFCGLIDQDSYFLVSVARCETLQVSFDYDADTRFPSLDAYAWMPEPAGSSAESGEQSDSELHAWVTDAVDAKLVQKGFRPDTVAPDFLVSFNIPVESQGELSLVFVFAENQQFLWRGTAIDSGYPARNADARELRIRMAVGRLLEQFPPTRSQ